MGLQDAMPGVRSHGVVTGVQEYGLFISFFGGVSGLAHSLQLGLAPNQTLQDAFQVLLLVPLPPSDVYRVLESGGQPGWKLLLLLLSYPVLEPVQL